MAEEEPKIPLSFNGVLAMLIISGVFMLLDSTDFWKMWEALSNPAALVYFIALGIASYLTQPKD